VYVSPEKALANRVHSGSTGTVESSSKLSTVNNATKYTTCEKLDKYTHTTLSALANRIGPGLWGSVCVDDFKASSVNLEHHSYNKWQSKMYVH